MSSQGASIGQIRAAYPGIPGDYLAFLERLGAGEVGNGRFMLYGGFMRPEEVYGETPPGLEHVVLFGDDMAGYGAGFDTADWRVVEIDPTTMEAEDAAPSFATFVRERMLE